MFRNKSNILLKGLFLLLVAVWCASCGPKKPPESELDPERIGVNFWSSAMAEEESDLQIFVSGQGAYVLLQAGEDNPLIGEVVGAGLKPIFRFDAWGRTVPQCIYDGAICAADDDRELCDDCRNWSTSFARFIAQVNGVEPVDAEGSDDPVGLIQELENMLFVVGNEPWLDGGIGLRDYAAAYTVIWRAVHLDVDDPQYSQENPRFPDIKLLVTGQNFHAQGSSWGEDETVNTVTWPGLVSQQIWDNGADVDGYAIHTYGYGSDNPDCDRPDEACEIEDGWPGDDGFLNYKDQIDFEALADEELITTDFADHLAGKPVYITEFNTYASGGAGLSTCPHPPDPDTLEEDCPYVPAVNYPNWWIIRAANVVADDARIEGLAWYVGTPHGDPDWKYFALTEDHGMLPCARYDFRYVSGVGEAASPDCSPDNQVPYAAAHLLWDESNCVARANRTFVWGLDLGGSGLYRTTVTCSPPITYNLSGTEPGVFYASVVESVPPEGGTCTVTVYDGAGNYTERTIHNPGSIQIPGCDNPDDNHSAASSNSLPAGELLVLPEGARPMPKIAVLSGGFAGNLMQVLFDVGEPAVLVEEDFDPSATAAQYPVLLIPSGGLYGRGSQSFRARLEEYARQGGSIVAFAQQHGYEYGALPGGEVGGYGWNTDIACFRAAFEIENWHPMLSGLDHDTLDVHVDGYFITWPDEAQILLSRTANGYPGAVLYPFGEGWVLATNIYDDWGSGHGQIAQDACMLLRDLLTWAFLPPGSGESGRSLPQYAPGEPVALDVQITNTTPFTATAAALRLVDPARRVVSEHTTYITVPAGTVASVPFTITAATPHGIWRIDASLMASEFYRLTRDVQVARYAVVREFPDAGSSDKASLSISAPGDTFPRGSVGVFTFRVQNHTALTQTVDVRWERDRNCRWGALLAEDAIVPPMEEVALQLETPVWDTFRLRGCAIGDDFVTNDSHPVILTYPEIQVALARDRAGYVHGDPVTLTAGLTNTAHGRLPLTLDLLVLDSRNQPLHTATSAITLPAASDQPGVATTIFLFTLPQGTYGTATAALTARNQAGRAVGGQQTDLHVVPSPLAFDLAIPPVIVAGVPSTLDVSATNLSPVFDVNDGTLTLTLEEPDGSVVASDTALVSLSAGATTTLQLELALPTLQFGEYVARFDATDEYGDRSWALPWSATPHVDALLDAPTHQAGGLAHLDLRLINPGPFVLPLTMTLSSPTLSYLHTQSFSLASYGVITRSQAISIPSDVTVGAYPLTLTLVLPPGDVVTQTPAIIQIPPSELSISNVSPSATAGQAITVVVTNVGGVPTWGTYELVLRDAAGRKIHGATDSVPNVDPGQHLPVVFIVPAGAVSGQYYLYGRVTDAQTDETRFTVQRLQVDGLTVLLEAWTGREVYASDETISATAVITNQGTPLTDGELTLRIVRQQGDQWPLWDVYNTENSDLMSNDLSAVAVDGEGNVWFGKSDYYYGVGPGSIDVLSADLETWSTYNLPLDISEVADIAVGGDNRKWFATDAGVARLSADNAVWHTFTTGNSGLVSDWATSVAVDDEGNAWIGAEGGVSVLTAGGEWVTYTTGNSGLASDCVYEVAADDSGNVWFGTDGGLSKLTSSGTWFTYTAETSGLLGDYVYDIALDGAGNAWMATPDYDGGVSVLLSDGNWVTYTLSNSDLSSGWVSTVAVDGVGRVWIGYYGVGVDVILSDDLPWNHYDAGDEEVLSSPIIMDIAVAPSGDVWLATERYNSSVVDGGATRAYAGDPWPIWDIYDTSSSDATSNWLEAVALDLDGNVWFGHNDEGAWEGSSRPVGLAAPRRQWGAETIDVLSADLETWSTFDLPLSWPSAVNDITVDRYDRKWFATDGGVAMLSADNTAWDTFTTDNSGLVSDWVNSVAVDRDGNAWFGTEEGVSMLTAGGEWITYTLFNSDLLDNWVFVVAVDDDGDAWFGTAAGLNQLTSEGAWVSYTEENSDLLSDYVFDIAFDEQGNPWMATPGYGGGVCALLRDGSWVTYTLSNSGLSEELSITAIAVDASGRTWIGYDGYDEQGVDVLLADGATWKHYEWEDEYGLSGDIVNDITAAPNGEVWLATQPWDPWGEPEGGATRVYGAGFGRQVLWTRDLSVDLGSPDVFGHTAAVAAAWLRATGKLILEAELASPTDQEITYDEHPFYVFPGDMVVTLDAEPPICRPGHAITLTGQVQNTGVVTLTERTLIVTQDLIPVYLVGPFDLPPGGHVAFSTAAIAPGDADATAFEASVGETEATEVVQIAEPVVSADVLAPSLVDRQPFSFTIILTNTGQMPAQAEATVSASDPQIADLQTLFTIAAGQVHILQQDYQIDHDISFTVTFLGDFTDTLTHEIGFGEAVEVTFSPRAIYPEGTIVIPYVLTNTGQLPVGFTTTITVSDDGLPVAESVIETYLPTGGSTSQDLLLELAVGDYALTYATPFGSGEEAFRVVPGEDAELSAAVGPRQGGVVTITVVVTNTGFRPLSGTLRLETPFFLADHAIHQPGSLPAQRFLPLNTAAALPGTYPVTLTVLGESGRALASSSVAVTVPGADLVLTDVPINAQVEAGQWVTLTFGVANQGSAPGTAVLTVTLSDLVDEAQSVWLPGSASDVLSFGFQAPAGLSGEQLVGEYWFEGQRYELGLSVTGVDLDVVAGWDQGVYDPGMTATLHITIANRSSLSTPSLYVHVAYQGQVITQPLTLAGEQSSRLDFPLAAGDYAADPKVFYAIYETGEHRGVYLNTTYLYVSNPEVTIVPDRHVYLPGDTVRATIITTATGPLTVTAPSFTSTIQLPASGFQFDLPADLVRGTYSIDYALEGGPTRSTPFDVDAVWVRIVEARLLGLPYAPGDDVRAELTVASTASLEVAVRAWVLYPDGMRSASVAGTAWLQDALNNRVSVSLPLSTTQAGPHSLVYWLTDPADPERVYASGLETFDVGSVVILGLYTDRREYLHTYDPVTAVATLLATGETSALVEWQLDGTPIASQAASLVTGTQPLTLPVPGPLAPGNHVVRVRASAGGLSDEAEAEFLYGADGPDLLVGKPYLYKPSTLTTTIRTYVYNQGKEAVPATTLHLYDGDPAVDGELIAEITVPPLPAKDSAYQHTREFLVTWDVTGLAGPHTLYAVADAGDVVQEIREDNNTALAQVEVPRLSLAVSTDKEAYDRGEPVDITVRAANLQAGGDLNVGLTTTVNLRGWEPFEVAELLAVPAGTLVEREYTWEYAETRGGEYVIRAEAVGEMGIVREHVGFFIPHAAEFVATPLSGTAPLTVTFTDLSSPWGWVDSWLWDFGDGSQAVTETNPVHIYTAPRAYTVTLTTTVGVSTYVQIKPSYVTVLPQEPQVEAGPDRSGSEGDSIAFTAVITDPDTPTGHSITWDFGDGTTVAGTLTPSHVYADDGVFEVTVSVTDTSGLSASDSLSVVVSNMPPVVDAGPDRTASEGASVLMNGSFTDPGALDTHVVEWSFGDGSTASGTLTPVHIWADDGVYTVTLTVTDDDGGEDSDTLLVTVSNVAPVVNAGPDRTVDEGDAVTLVGSFDDPGTADTHSVVWSLGDGSSVSGQLTVTHVYTATGIYTTTLTVTDDDGGVGTDEAGVTVGEPVTHTPSTDVGDYAILGLNSVWMQWDSDLHSGRVGVQNASPGPVLDPDGTWVTTERIPGCRWGHWWYCWRWRFYKPEVSIGHGVTFHDPASAIAGDTVRLKQGADVFDVYCNEFKADPGATYGEVYTPLSLPLVTNLPALPEITPGATDYVLGWQEDLALPAGAYGDIWLGGRSVLTLTGGVYHFASLRAGYESRIVVTAPSQVRIAGRLGTSLKVVVGPAPGSGLDASDLVIFVAGTDGCPGGGRPCFFPKSATIGYQNSIAANLYAPNGTLWLISRTQATGAFIARDVNVGSSTQVWLKSGFAGESPAP